MYGIGAGLFREGSPEAAAQCTQMTVNRTSAFNGTYDSLVEINMDDQSVRELRLAYYAVISLTDTQLGRVLDTLSNTGLDDNTIVTFIGVRFFLPQPPSVKLNSEWVVLQCVSGAN
jgi:hypothetical protein